MRSELSRTAEVLCSDRRSCQKNDHLSSTSSIRTLWSSGYFKVTLSWRHTTACFEFAKQHFKGLLWVCQLDETNTEFFSLWTKVTTHHLANISPTGKRGDGGFMEWVFSVEGTWSLVRIEATVWRYHKAYSHNNASGQVSDLKMAVYRCFQSKLTEHDLICHNKWDKLFKCKCTKQDKEELKW